MTQGGEALGSTTASMTFVVVAVSEDVVGPLLFRQKQNAIQLVVLDDQGAIAGNG